MFIRIIMSKFANFKRSLVNEVINQFLTSKNTIIICLLRFIEIHTENFTTVNKEWQFELKNWLTAMIRKSISHLGEHENNKADFTITYRRAVFQCEYSFD